MEIKTNKMYIYTVNDSNPLTGKVPHGFLHPPSCLKPFLLYLTETCITASDKLIKRKCRRQTIWKSTKAEKDNQPFPSIPRLFHIGVQMKYLIRNSMSKGETRLRCFLIQLAWYLCSHACPFVLLQWQKAKATLTPSWAAQLPSAV